MLDEGDRIVLWVLIVGVNLGCISNWY